MVFVCREAWVDSSISSVGGEETGKQVSPYFFDLYEEETCHCQRTPLVCRVPLRGCSVVTWEVSAARAEVPVHSDA